MGVNLTDFVLGILTASFATAIGALINLAVNQYVDRKKKSEERKILSNIFLLCIDSCINHTKTTVIFQDFANWKFLPWEHSQLHIARIFPDEFKEFTHIINSLSTIYISDDINTIQEKLKSLRSKVERQN